jgi:hypothetical protein
MAFLLTCPGCALASSVLRREVLGNVAVAGAGQPSELLKDLEDSIRKTRQLLQRVEAFPGSRDVGCDFCPMGDGAFNITTVREMMLGGLELPRNPPPVRWPQRAAPDELVAAINRKWILDRLLIEIRRHNKQRRQGGQKKPDQRAIVARAAYFFRQYANEKPTTYFDGPFYKFCRSFYGIVTGARLAPSGLEKAIKSEVKNPTIGT